MAKTYRVGAIGTAWAARSPLPTFRSMENVELLAVCSARLDRAKATANQFGAPLAFDDYREMVQLADLDIVYVGSPVYLHHPMVLAAAAANKHVICEKPLALKAQQGREMIEALESRGLAHACAFTMRNFPSSVYVKKAIEDGFIGELRHINATMWRGAAAGGPPRSWTWLFDSELGGGFLGAMGSHYIDLIRSWAGEYTDVYGKLRTWNTESVGDDGESRTVTAEDSLVLLATLASGAVVTISFASEIRAATGRRVEIYGSHGSIVVDGDNGVRIAAAGDKELHPIDVPEPDFPANVLATTVPRFGQIVDQLIRQIEGGPVASPNLHDGLKCQEVQDAVKRSIETSCAVAL